MTIHFDPQGREPEQFTIRRDGDRDLRLRGWRVAAVSTLHPDAMENVQSIVAASKRWKEMCAGMSRGRNPELPEVVEDVKRIFSGSRRWRELSLYRTEGKNWVCHKAGLSSVPSEVDRHRAIRIVAYDPDRHVIKPDEVGMWHVPEWERNFEYVEDALIEFFGRDSLAKDLYEELGIEDIELVE